MSHDRPNDSLRFVVILLSALSFADLAIMLALVVLHAAAPGVVSPDVLQPLAYLLGGSSLAALAIGFLYVVVRYPSHRKTLLTLAIIVLVVLVAHLVAIGLPPTPYCRNTARNVDGCAMDEVYYVPAAQTLLSGARCAPYADNCNLEHPFLSKAFIAAGIAIFGNGDFGWRIFEVILGTFSIPLLFGICWSVTKNDRLCIYAAFLLAFETLFFVHSSIAVIDVPAIFFALLGFLFYFSEARFWRLGKTALAGIALGLSGLSKETGVLFVVFLAVYIIAFGEGNRRNRVLSSLGLMAVVGAVFIAGLQVYDSLFGAGSATTVWGHINFILSYGASLKGIGWVDTLLHRPITPFDWMVYYSPVSYLITEVQVRSLTGALVSIGAGYYGDTSPLLVWLTYLWVGYTLYLLVKRRREPPSADTGANDLKLARFAMVWFGLVYAAYITLYLHGRVTYPYYMIDVVPALAIGGAFLLSRPRFPAWARYLILGVIAVWFIVFYPAIGFIAAV